jgi:hypothetical protein
LTRTSSGHFFGLGLPDARSSCIALYQSSSGSRTVSLVSRAYALRAISSSGSGLRAVGLLVRSGFRRRTSLSFPAERLEGVSAAWLPLRFVNLLSGCRALSAFGGCAELFNCGDYEGVDELKGGDTVRRLARYGVSHNTVTRSPRWTWRFRSRLQKAFPPSRRDSPQTPCVRLHKPRRAGEQLRRVCLISRT